MRTRERDGEDCGAAHTARADAPLTRAERDVLVALAKLFAPLPSHRRAGPFALRLRPTMRG